jgi:hypothetical protein
MLRLAPAGKETHYRRGIFDCRILHNIGSSAGRQGRPQGSIDLGKMAQ